MAFEARLKKSNVKMEDMKKRRTTTAVREGIGNKKEARNCEVAGDDLTMCFVTVLFLEEIKSARI